MSGLSYAQNMFLACLGVFWPVLGPAGADPQPSGRRAPKNPRFKNLSCFESFDPIFFRLLKHPKRLGLGQKVPGKHLFGPIEPRFMGPKKTQVPERIKMGKNGIFAMTVFRVLAIKRAKQGNLFIVGYI